MSANTRSDTGGGAAQDVGPWVYALASRKRQLNATLLRCVDAGLAGVIFVVPFVMGGRQALGQLIFVALALWTAVSWCLRQCVERRAAWIRSPAELLLLAALALVGLQLAVLPPGFVDLVSPHLYDVLPLWSPQGEFPASLGSWSTLSLTPAATRDGLVLLLAFALLLLTTIQRVRRVRDVERLIRWVAISASAMAAFGLVQYLSGNGKFFWFYEHPFTDTHRAATGAFPNPNHFAHFLTLGVGPLIWWIQSGLQRDFQAQPARQRTWGAGPVGPNSMMGLRILGLGLCVFGVLMSLSRGGIMVMFVAALVCMLILYRGSLIGGRSVAILAAIGLLVGAGLYIYGYELVASELDDFGSLEDLDRGQGRRRLWAADAAGIADYPLIGTGIGSHREVYPLYLHDARVPQSIEYTHAESGYVQVGLEAGVPGLLLVLSAIALCCYWCLWPLRHGAPTRVLLCVAAIAASLAASIVHSIADFVWYVPGCMVTVVVLAACACRLGQLNRHRTGKSAAHPAVPRIAWVMGASCLVLIGYCMLQNRVTAAWSEPCWHRYLRLARSFPKLDGVYRYNTLKSMAKELSTALQRRPDFARAHMQLAAVSLQLFNHSDDPQVTALGVRQVREAALASQFDSPAALDQWLWRAFGSRRKHLDVAWQHVRQALTLCPLQGEGYLYLADLSFLEGPNSPGKAAYVEQALKVRPFDGAVLLEAGNEAALAGELEKALGYWRAAFHCGPEQQRALIQHLAAHAPASFFLNEFQPDLPALARLKNHYRTLDRPDDSQLLCQRYAEAAENQARLAQGQPAATNWTKAADAYRELDNWPERLRCLRQAVRCDPSNFYARRALGECLYQLGEFVEAAKHLTWCSQRKPRDSNLRALLEDAVSQRLRQAGQPGSKQTQPARVTGEPNNLTTRR